MKNLILTIGCILTTLLLLSQTVLAQTAGGLEGTDPNEAVKPDGVGVLAPKLGQAFGQGVKTASDDSFCSTCAKHGAYVRRRDEKPKAASLVKGSGPGTGTNAPTGATK